MGEWWNGGKVERWKGGKGGMGEWWKGGIGGRMFFLRNLL